MNQLRRENVPALASYIFERPVRWASQSSYAGRYDGHENTLEVFNVNATDQLSMLRKIRPERATLEAAAGGPLVVVFHTEERTRRFYQDVLPLTVMSGVFIDGEPSGAAIEVDMVPFSDGDAPRPLVNGARMLFLVEQGTS